MHSEISEFPNFADTAFWIRVNLKDFKYSLLNEVTSWIKLFKDYLKNHVIDSLKELEEFIEMADETMSQEIDKEEYEKFIEILSVLNKVENRSMDTDNMFEPLKDIVELLKDYNEEVDNKVMVQVNQPNVVKSAYQLGECITNLYIISFSWVIFLPNGIKQRKRH